MEFFYKEQLHRMDCLVPPRSAPYAFRGTDCGEWYSVLTAASGTGRRGTERYWGVLGGTEWGAGTEWGLVRAAGAGGGAVRGHPVPDDGHGEAGQGGLHHHDGPPQVQA
eukprot:2386364-Rhodomonas_salina.1